ncbi:urease accessory protein UreF [Sneathiella sp.]|uniref:urease accessory protein UreF n=1 Tax=Sneathiella sp. TaxID=1964365 RepID=UPI00261ADCE8|nr:urease accessory protein UreF [Sneathiella sp.]MDF2366358.1 urease accessory protein UreF [Sneathiella sp.]
MDNRALFNLMSWMSPSYPIGAYTYSHGIEYAVEAGLVTSLDDLVPWIADILEYGSGTSDGILLAAAYRATQGHNLEALKEITEIGNAFAPTKEIALETTQQGRAFVSVIGNVSAEAKTLAALAEDWHGPLIHPVAVGIVAADHGVPLNETLTAYLHGFVSNLVSAAVRLVPLGQTDGQRAIAALADEVDRVTTHALETSLDELGSATLMVDWCSASHETQYTRLFRS